ncbi:hypothetical protein [Tenacibaculum jejuense]|uniref:Uncharacterized protein n=1 Tax=Tenacibaculum jejuense TaxID=584609 RepID=A0A238U4W7_9FLAO|nr:hypothetical protein [Tenacibaculum jejuense]SNR14066.1 protein of unknown function [Tenacibaculum jejuense]
MSNKNSSIQISPKEAIEKAKEAAEKTQTYIDEAKEILEKGGTLSKLQDFIKRLDGIGSASYVFGALSAGLEIATFLSGEKSTEEKMIEMLSNISKQIDDLRSRMDYQFDRLKTYINYKLFTNRFSEAKYVFDALNNKMMTYKKLKEDKDVKEEQIKDFENDDLLTINQTVIFDKAQELTNLINGSTLSGDNILVASQEQTFGDIRFIMVVGNTILNYVILAMQLEGTLVGIRGDREGKSHDRILNEIDNKKIMYNGLIQEIKTGLKNALINVKKEEVSDRYIASYCENEIFQKLSADNLQESADILGKILSEQWFWYDWVVITYDPVSGYDRHGVAGYFKFYPRQIVGGGDNKGKINIVLSKTEKECRPTPRDYKTIEYAYDKVRHRENRGGNIYYHFKEYLNKYYEDFKDIGMIWVYNDEYGHDRKYAYFHSGNYSSKMSHQYQGGKFPGSPEVDYLDYYCNSILHV